MKLYLDRVSKHFKDKKAVDEISLEITPGIWGILGANGAGKTTLMRIAAGIMAPSSGSVAYDGIPIRTLQENYRDILGYLPQEFGFYPEFRVLDYLEYMAVLKGLSPENSSKKIESLLCGLGLSEVRHKRISKLSGGMKRRVGIAQALLNDPRILILDEPTSGLDPGERIHFRNLLSEFAQNRIVIVSTHIVSDIEYIASQIVIMKDGRLAAEGPEENLIRLIRGKVWSCSIPAAALPEYERKLRITNLRNEMDGRLSVRYLAEHPFDPNDISVDPRLEDLYLYLFPQSTESIRR